MPPANGLYGGVWLVIWLMIALIVALAVGPILWLRPKPRERAVAALRTAARQAGLTVSVAHVPNLAASAEERVSAGGRDREPTIECASYRLLAPGRLDDAPQWTLYRSEHENRYLAGWTTLAPPSQLPAQAEDYWRQLAAIIDDLPGGCLAVEASADGVAWMGRERLGDADAAAVVKGIREGLEALRELHLTSVSDAT